MSSIACRVDEEPPGGSSGPSGGRREAQEESGEDLSTGAILSTLIGGPLIWACRASHYMRPEVTEEEEEELTGMPFWRQVRSLDLETRLYLNILGVRPSSLQRGRVETLELLLAAHREAIALRDRSHFADVRAAYSDVVRRQAISAAECNLLLGWLASRLELFFEVKFVLARRRRPDDADPSPLVVPATSIRTNQPHWGPAAHIVLFVSTSPNVKRLVDASLPMPVDLLDVFNPDAPTSPPADSSRAQPTPVFRVFKHNNTSLYSVDEYSHRHWTTHVLFDARIKRPHAHFVHHPVVNSGADERACVDVDGI